MFGSSKSWGLNSTHLHGTHVPVEEPSTASIATSIAFFAMSGLGQKRTLSSIIWTCGGASASRHEPTSRRDRTSQTHTPWFFLWSFFKDFVPKFLCPGVHIFQVEIKTERISARDEPAFDCCSQMKLPVSVGLGRSEIL